MRSRRSGVMAPPPSFIWTRRIVLTLLTLFALTPVYVMVSSLLKPLQDVTGTFRWIPSPITFSSYIQMWQTVPLAQYFVNSLIVCTCAAALSVLVATFAAYAVSRYRFRGRRAFTLVVLSTQMFPGILFLLPLFLIFVSIGNATGITLLGSAVNPGEDDKDGQAERQDRHCERLRSRYRTLDRAQAGS